MKGTLQLLAELRCYIERDAKGEGAGNSALGERKASKASQHLGEH
jgi:hypothetical protein